MNKEERLIQEQKERNLPSRFPDLFPVLYAERWGGLGLEHWVEDNLMLGWPEGAAHDELEAGILHEGVRYVLFLGEHTGSPYNEWLVEAMDTPYWRIIFRIGLGLEPLPECIVAVFNETPVARFLHATCLVKRENLVQCQFD